MFQLGRFWRTVRWLKPAQVIGRLRFKLQRPKPDLRPAPAQRKVCGPWQTPAARYPSLSDGTHMTFLGESKDFTQVGWDNPELPLLWRYNQHYFDDLNAAGAVQRQSWHVAILAAWLAANPAGQGTAWAPYPLSLRVVNWVKWWLGGQPPEAALLDSLASQTRWLVQRLEWHLLGNHLFINAKALVYAGLFFEGAEAEGWLAKGLHILDRELQEQFLPDGGQFERSPMYHALALEDLLDLINVIEHLAAANSPARPLLQRLRACSALALFWLRTMTHPDGTLSRFNDTAEGIAPPLPELERLASALATKAEMAPMSGTLHLQSSGYARMARGEATLFLDMAPVGPDYLPGHAHADSLSFELSLNRRLVLVNRGTSEYGLGPRRQVERGTAAHNTVQVGAENSSEVWAGFRVGRRARTTEIRISEFMASAAHDGYVHLKGRPIHRRQWTLGDCSLLIEDHLDSPGDQQCPLPTVARFHLHPGLSLVESGAGWKLMAGKELIAHAEVLVGSASVETWQQAMHFGELAPAVTLTVALHECRSTVRWHWPH